MAAGSGEDAAQRDGAEGSDGPAPGTGRPSAEDPAFPSRPLPERNLPEASGKHWDFGLSHRYEPPLDIALERPLVAGESVAFVTRLPHPPNGDKADQAFFYRLTDGRVVGYFNRCTHITIPLDYDDGKFLDPQGFIMCRVHGARYELETGLRCTGPATTNLTRILVEEIEDGRSLRITGWEKIR
ncbi:MAG: Rieske (2Fe-2S) protein [bacterium]|nr:Rieske (2Fe-2S) protein [bacterium]